MRTYTVLRDLSRASTGEPFGRAGARMRGKRVAAEPRIDVEQLDKRDVRTLARDPDVRALAPVMPTALIRPFEVEASEASTNAWGIGAVGADLSVRSGAGVVVSVLDTGIDDTHPAFKDVALVQEDFSGSGNGDRDGHGTHCAGTVFGRDVDGTRIGVAPGVERALIGKVLADDGGGTSDMIFRGIQWALDGGARVISMSLGFDFPGFVQKLADEGWPVDLATSVALEAYRANLRVFDALMELAETRDGFGSGLFSSAPPATRAVARPTPTTRSPSRCLPPRTGSSRSARWASPPTGSRSPRSPTRFPKSAAPGSTCCRRAPAAVWSASAARAWRRRTSRASPRCGGRRWPSLRSRSRRVV